ncbi:MAG: 50S ribosomal protein L29 [Planctomycetes bacterium]|nr:50S ribosomal protein L29 [Planctomycetota bacterium]
MKAAEVRELSDEELAVELQNLQEGLFRLRVRKITENIHNAGEVRSLRRDIARVLTIMRERQLAREGK